MYAEKNIAAAIRESGMTIKAVSKKTGIRYSLLQPSLSGRRELRADEYLSLCWLLGLDVWKTAGADAGDDWTRSFEESGKEKGDERV